MEKGETPLPRDDQHHMILSSPIKEIVLVAAEATMEKWCLQPTKKMHHWSAYDTALMPGAGELMPNEQLTKAYRRFMAVQEKDVTAMQLELSRTF